MNQAGTSADQAAVTAGTNAATGFEQALTANGSSIASLVSQDAGAVGAAALSELQGTASWLGATADGLSAASQAAEGAVDALSSPSRGFLQQLLGSALALPQSGRRLLQVPDWLSLSKCLLVCSVLSMSSHCTVVRHVDTLKGHCP